MAAEGLLVAENPLLAVEGLLAEEDTLAEAGVLTDAGIIGDAGGFTEIWLSMEEGFIVRHQSVMLRDILLEIVAWRQGVDGFFGAA